MHKVTITHANATENREAWLAIRRRHVTATDWPKITGTSRWGNVGDVINGKLGEEPERWSVPPLPIRVGNELEPLIIEQTKIHLGRGDYLSQAFISRRHIGFTPDLALIDKPSGWVLAEIKVSVMEWGGSVPPDYLDQVKFQATVLGVDEVLVVHLQLRSWKEGLWMIGKGAVPTDRLVAYKVPVDEAERLHIEREAERWWKRCIGH